MERPLSPDCRRVESVFLALLVLIGVNPLFSQSPSVQALAESSSVIVRGRVLRLNASDEPLLPASRRTAIVRVLRMYAGREIAGDQTGNNVTVILSRSGAVNAGQEALFFGNVRFVGATMTIADVGESPAGANDSSNSELDRAGQRPSDRAILDRLAVAALVFRGTVVEVRALEGRGGQDQRRPVSEHDPEWQVANVRIQVALRGGDTGQVVTIAFAASRDITWFNSPKLQPGQDAVFLAHTPNREEERFYRATGLWDLIQRQSIYLVTEPYDMLRPADETRVRDLLSRGRGR